MSLTQLSAEITDLLGLALAPVAITFHADSAPEGVRHFDAPMSEPTEDGRSGRVPASCVFWSYGHDETFTTVPEDHGNCSVGRFTHGIAPAEEILDKQDVGTLGETDVDPDVILLRITPRQMMEVADAVDVEFSGKPQCQIIPRALESGTIAASMGCALSRERIGMGDDELTVAVPAARFEELVTALRSVCRADEAVVGYAAADKERFVTA